jgi:plasminogen activator inhibitor 1 RNA-binding protein
LNLPEARQANEGVDNTQWKNTAVFAREVEEEEFFVVRQKTSDKNKVKQQRSQKATQVFEIEQRFSDQSNRGTRGGRGGRGGNRGGRGQNNSRGNNAQVNVNDEVAFPSLRK